MGKRLESMLKKGKMIALAGIAATAIGCSSAPHQAAVATQQENNTSQETTAAATANKYLAGKTLDSYFKEFDAMGPSQQEAMAKSINEMSAWDIVLLSRYIPLDGMLKGLSSHYSTDYKWYLQSLLSESGLDPTVIGGGIDKGLGQISPSSEKWARELYNDKSQNYRFPGPEIKSNILDPYTNLVLSSIIFRKDAEEKVSDLESLYALYTRGFDGVSLNDKGYYETNSAGKKSVERAKTFDSVADKMIIFSWISMDKPQLGRYIEDVNLQRAVRMNNSKYDEESAYRGMIGMLNSEASNREKYSDDTQKIFRDESTKMANWVNKLYGNFK